ncbi:dirigent protein 4-like [Gastrolobium bilobum]|uniref:dirigent protein 4-like n=1 Tax=Gastrolobium bilobum TaxID=150636 RepID=UPI002AAFA195|nr:dirigent protein 4-like [Gastrolobium bilobum]
MENRAILMVLAFLLCGVNINVLVSCEYHYADLNGFQQKEKVTHLHFYLFDTLSGNKPSSVEIARPNITTIGEKSPAPFGHAFAIDDPLREGPDEKSKVIGNAEGLYLSSSQGEKLTLVYYVDFGFTTGEYNGSSISVFSRNPVTEKDRELAVVGGRGKFRMARGFAHVRAHFLNPATGDAILEYNVTLLHY